MSSDDEDVLIPFTPSALSYQNSLDQSFSNERVSG